MSLFFRVANHMSHFRRPEFAYSLFEGLRSHIPIVYLFYALLHRTQKYSEILILHCLILNTWYNNVETTNLYCIYCLDVKKEEESHVSVKIEQ
jgi:hypothetical protein